MASNRNNSPVSAGGEIFGAYLPDPIQLHGKHYYSQAVV